MKIIMPLIFFCAATYAFVFSGNVQEELMTQKLRKFKATGVEKKMILKKGTNSESLVLEAKKYLGFPSKEQNPMGFQGEEFIQTVLGKFAYESFHNSYAELGRYGKMIIDANDLQKGDLVYFMDLSKTEPSFSHAGIYIEDGKFIYLSSQKGITIGSLEDSEYWKSKFAFGTRLLN